MEKEHINICVEREVSEVLDKAKKLTGFSKSQLIKRYALVLNCCLDVLERNFMIQIIPYVRKPIKGE